MESATFKKPAMLAPATRSPGLPYCGRGVGGIVVEVGHDLLEVSRPPPQRSRTSAWSSGSSPGRRWPRRRRWPPWRGQRGRLAAWKASTASGVQGILAPSATAKQPFCDQGLGGLADPARSGWRRAGRCHRGSARCPGSPRGTRRWGWVRVVLPDALALHLLELLDQGAGRCRWGRRYSRWNRTWPPPWRRRLWPSRRRRWPRCRSRR